MPVPNCRHSRLLFGDLPDRPDGVLHFRLRIVMGKTESHRALFYISERFVHQRRAMSAGSGRDPIGHKQFIADLRRIIVPHIQRDDRTAVFLRKIAVHRHARNPRHTVIESPHSFQSKIANRFQTCFFYIIECGVESCDPMTVERACLQRGRHLRRMIFIVCIDPASAPFQRTDLHSRARTYIPPVPCGPSNPLCPVKHNTSICISCTSTGTCPAVCDASSTNNTPCFFAIAPIFFASFRFPRQIGSVGTDDHFCIFPDRRFQFLIRNISFSSHLRIVTSVPVCPHAYSGRSTELCSIAVVMT